ncbi:MAG: response regulator transcription factor, partial [Chloroflexi bacterium]|nr:response regulator transcription factor [Chloroflexota bacterium]
MHVGALRLHVRTDVPAHPSGAAPFAARAVSARGLVTALTTTAADNRSTILVVEDDRHTAEIVRLYLEREGHSVVVASDGQLGLRLAKEKKPALIVLDLMLPGMDGLEVCRSLRAEANDVPVIMLTARVEEHDKLAGLDLGADDYVTKPFSPRELAARVRAVMRRTGKEGAVNGDQVLARGELKIDLGSR